jgi:hypothetical protein
MMSSHRLVNASLVRGIVADTYSSPHSDSNIPAFPDGLPGKGPAAPTNFNFDMQLMFFPRGWGFPGRGVNGSEVVLPIRIRNAGQLQNSTASYAYQDVWDLFMLLPQPPPVGRFDPTTIGCPSNGWVAPGAPVPAAPTSTVSPSSLALGSAGAWVGGIAVGAGVVALGVAIWRWRDMRSRASHEQLGANGAVPLGNTGTRH